MTQEIIRFFVMVLGNTMNSHKTFMERLTISQKLREVKSVNNSDVIIAFVPVVSRAGTDIGAAMAKIPQGKPVVLVVLHHTFDQDYIAPDSRLCVNRKYVFAVDCLYHEDQGLLNCLRNDDAIRAVKKHLRCDDHIEDDSSCASCVGFHLCKSDAETGGRSTLNFQAMLIPVHPRPSRRRCICLGVSAFVVVVIVLVILFLILNSDGHGDTQTTVIPPITVATHQPNITVATQQRKKRSLQRGRG
ncbi:uncharacterized protein LOC108262139 isoform X6 [Ictalurus punctatus]|uniref:Uncharacterized protein LOC108262139 isoform X6 n=1 Tax=Ictalurus punctatus TaxID=7998 RepID=A0A9F7R368_ICTPU|nr:uncharacterized protein LOC108262139 isoform X6 [Ictalurus punctatus]